jgi:acetate kinase
MRVLVLNPGSSTLKASLLEDEDDRSADELVEWPAGDRDAAQVVRSVLEALPKGADAAGYRVVHGGGDYRGPAAVDERLISRVEELDALAPLHNRRAAAVMRAGVAALPDLPHVACFDTAFHAGLPEEAWRYPIPVEWAERHGIRRFGFHGLSIEWSVRRAAELLGRDAGELRLMVAHLGSGCSVTAVDGGRSVDTSMGYTPYEGLMMGTRSGSIDPGILLRLAAAGVGTDDVAEGLSQRSGLRAIGGTADLRAIEEAMRAGDVRARLAFDMFARRAAAAIGAAQTTMPAMDALVFTGGIGEHSAAMRGSITGRLDTLGVPPADGPVSGDAVLAAGPPAVLVVEAREDVVIAGQVRTLLEMRRDRPTVPHSDDHRP